jgi:hypothetical protein
MRGGGPAPTGEQSAGPRWNQAGRTVRGRRRARQSASHCARQPSRTSNPFPIRRRCPWPAQAAPAPGHVIAGPTRRLRLLRRQCFVRTDPGGSERYTAYRFRYAVPHPLPVKSRGTGTDGAGGAFGSSHQADQGAAAGGHMAHMAHRALVPPQPLLSGGRMGTGCGSLVWRAYGHRLRVSCLAGVWAQAAAWTGAASRAWTVSGGSDLAISPG